MVLGGRVFWGIEQARRRCLEAGAVVGKRDAEALAIGGGLLMGERKAAQRLRQSLGGSTFVRTAGAGNKVIGADRLGPEAQFDRLRKPRQAGAFEVTRTWAAPPRGR